MSEDREDIYNEDIQFPDEDFDSSEEELDFINDPSMDIILDADADTETDLADIEDSLSEFDKHNYYD